MFPEYTGDGVHPNLEGYKLMEPLMTRAINEILGDVTNIESEKSTFPEVRISGVDGQIMIETAYDTAVLIYNLEGVLIKKEHVRKGVNYLSIGNGIYLVRINEFNSKVVVY